MNPTVAAEYAERGLQCRLAGKYTEAVYHFQLAYENANREQKPDILLNWADTLRRWPGKVREANEMLEEALTTLEPVGRDTIKVHAAAQHHLARLHRQRGRYEAAQRLLKRALEEIHVHNRNLREGSQELPIDILTMSMDMASIEAILGRPRSAREHALTAFTWLFYWPFWQRKQLGLAHVLRVLILLAFAKHPGYPNLRVRRAFFGRT